MNYYIAGLILEAVLFTIYFLSTKKTIKKLIIIGTYWKNEAVKLNTELKQLQDQYRQLAKINEAMRDINKLKK